MLEPDYFMDQALRGNMFCYSTALAGNALVAATTTNAPMIFNPSGSGKIGIIYKITYNRTAKGTPLEGGIVYLKSATNLGASVGTGAPVVSGTHVAPQNALIGSTRGSAFNFYPTTVVVTTALTYFANAGIAQTADNGATTVSGPRAEMAVDRILGAISILPGHAFALGAQVALSTTYAITIWGLEIDKPSYVI